MIRSRFSLLGVLVAAIGLMAAFASAAQAETGAQWLILKTVGGSLETLAEMEAEELEGSLEGNTGSLLSEILGAKIDIKCTAGTLVNAHPGPNGSVKEGAKVKFTGCKFFSGGTNGLEKEQPKCEVKTNGGAVGTIESLSGHALIELNGGNNIVLILPDNAEGKFTNIETGVKCAFGENVPVFGVLAVQDCGGNTKALEHLEIHLISEYPAATKLKILEPAPNGNTATIDGSANIKLVSGKQYSGHPA